MLMMVVYVVMLMAIEMLMAKVMGCHSPCELWELDAIHHANGNIPCMSLMLMLMLMLMALGMLMTMLMLMLIAMEMLMAMQLVLLMAIHP